MSQERVDPSGNTEAFRAFVRAGQPEPAPARAPIARTPIIVGAAIGAAVLIAVIVVLLAM